MYFQKKRQDNKYKIDKVFFKRIYRLIYPYWFQKSAFSAWVMLGLVVVFTTLISLLGGYLSYKSADLANLQLARDHQYWTLFIWVTFISLLHHILNLIPKLLSERINLQWREWLTQYLIQCFMKNRVYYDIAFKENLDNPDQRIQEHVQSFCSMISEIPTKLFGASLNIGIQVGILLSISSTFLWSNIIYTLIILITSYLFMLPLIKKNWIEVQSNADFRTALVNVREYSENIAFFRGEKHALHTIISKVHAVYDISRNILKYNLKVNIANTLINRIQDLLPVLILVPLFFSNQIEYGAIAQASTAASILVGSFSVIYDFIPKLADLAPLTVRLAEVQEKSDHLIELKKQRKSEDLIDFDFSKHIKIQNLNLLTPGAEQKLVQNLTIQVKPQEHLLITGRTGIGKSSLLRVMAGLWDRGNGQVGIPHAQDLMFFPQRPYMLNADLRSQLIYPATSTSLTDKKLQQILNQVGKGYISERYGGFDAIRNWARELSLGEQQCLSIARLLIHSPQYAFLDEASSALDFDTEQLIYQTIIESGTTIISVGHRASIVRFHRKNLVLKGYGQWEFNTIEHYEDQYENKLADINQPVEQVDLDTIIKDSQPQSHLLSIQELNQKVQYDQQTKTDIDRKDLKLNRLFFKRVYDISKPYWTRKGWWKSFIIYVICFLSTILLSLTGAYYSVLAAKEIDALVAKDHEVYWFFMIILMLYGLTTSFLETGFSYLKDILRLKWVKWLSEFFSQKYLSNRTYYEIIQEDKIDNPDQRIQDEISPFCRNVLGLPMDLFRAITDIGVYIVILIAISSKLLIFVFVYAILNFFITLVLLKPTIKKSFLITKSEADFRYSLLRVRENAENIAFYRGENSEMKQIYTRLRLVIQHRWNLEVYNALINIIFFPIGILWTVVPILILVPLYFGHQISFGQIAQATLAAGMISNAFNKIIHFIPQFSNMVPGVVRLAEIFEKSKQLDASVHAQSPIKPDQFEVVKSDALTFENVNLMTPGGEIALVQNLNLRIQPQQHMVIIGQTGVGKSSLLRALAGLWHRGTGRISSPDEHEKIFLAQRPYLMEGTLRSQLIYPALETTHSDAFLINILERVQLGDLINKYGGLDVENHWGKKLSLGEQQRIGFARLLIQPRKYVFLDEATSAVDAETEHKLYMTLLDSGATVVSICHQKTAWKYHQHYLKLLPEGQYEVGYMDNKMIA